LICQGLDDSRDTMTAKAINTPHLHFSHKTWRSCPVHPCGVVVGLFVDAKLLVFTTSLACDVVVAAGACAAGRLSHTCSWCVAVVDLEIEGENGLGLVGEVGVAVVSGFPLSCSPILGRSGSIRTVVWEGFSKSWLCQIMRVTASSIGSLVTV